MSIRERLTKGIQDREHIHRELLNNEQLSNDLDELCKLIVACFKNKGRVLFAGNGGSAADAQHLAAELSGRFFIDRPPIDAEALQVNSSFTTAVANDYGFDEVFSRAVQAKGRPGDILILYSTSGTSSNIIRAAQQGKQDGLLVVAFTGQNESALAKYCRLLFAMPSNITPRIQEAHLFLGHLFCAQVEQSLFGK